MNEITCPHCGSSQVKEVEDQDYSTNQMGEAFVCHACQKHFYIAEPTKPKFIVVNKSKQSWKVAVDGDEENQITVKPNEVSHLIFNTVYHKDAVTITIQNEPNSMTVLAGVGGLLHLYEQFKAKKEKQEKK